MSVLIHNSKLTNGEITHATIILCFEQFGSGVGSGKSKKQKKSILIKIYDYACDATHVYLILDCFLKLKKTLSVWTIGSKEIQETK